MKDETEGVAIVKCVGLKSKMSHNEYKVVLLNNKCTKHSMSRIQSKDHRRGTYEVNKISLSCFDDKIYIQNNGYDELALGYQS